MGGGQYHHRRSRGSADSPKTESGQSRGDCRIPLKQDRAVMQIRKLTAQTEKRMLAQRAQDRAETHAMFGMIVADVRKNRNALLFAYAKRFDHTVFCLNGAWTTEKEIRVA